MSESEGAGYDVPEIAPIPERLWKARLKRWLWPLGIATLAATALVAVRPPLTLTYPCRVLPSHVEYVRSPLTSVVAKMHVREGDLVEKGTLLVSLASADLKVALTRSESNLARARAEMALLQKGSRPEERKRAAERVRGLKRQLSMARARTRRLKSLAAESLVPVEETLDAQRGQATLEADLSTAEADHQLLLAGSRAEELEQKEAELKGLEAQVAFDRQALGLSEVHARNAGTVSTPRLEERTGSLVNAGELLLEVVSLEKMVLEVSVAERDFDALAVDQKVQFRVEAYPAQPFIGKVERIAEKVEADAQGNRVIARARVDNPEGRLRPNMSGYAEIHAGHRPLWEIASRRIIRWFRVRFLV